MTVLQHLVAKANSWCKITKYTTDKYKNKVNEDLYFPHYLPESDFFIAL
jgi:hypothetical protein